MKNVMLFEQKKVEVLELNGEVYFNPYDVAKCLGMQNSSVRTAMQKMNSRQVRKLTNSIVGKSNNRKLHSTGELFLTESGVYKLAFRSNKPNAEKFSDWVTDEVLPSIRKTGKYEVTKVPAKQSINWMKGMRCNTPKDVKIQEAIQNVRNKVTALMEILELYNRYNNQEEQQAYTLALRTMGFTLSSSVYDLHKIKPEMVEMYL